ncbi:MAG: substrate-binding domain-containing protein [Synergistaceae bacterium]|nr:substrate-binding domain-containing protein [Synergistaceae bacterium]MBQ6738662.1 substrate-binding domain-containing protein [Synergistaceae bacterium]MBQ7069596.1 substrate-binding domain-containing protein [Synergistaceae bacterium]MBR0079444.1 substrate-binding domain-containing protein [Synergistaceae bacterium]MBR0233163.1 substrate-binding domain-containing protein [Synergistaceae bacterium]
MKKFLAVLVVLSLVLGLSVSAMAAVKTKIGLITMDQMDVHWVRLKNAAEARVKALNEAGNEITMVWLAPETKDNQQQIEKIQNAVADGVNYIIIACNDGTSANRALQEALDAGIKIIYVDAPATLKASATYATDNFAGGKQIGEYLKALFDKDGITEGTIGIVDAQAGVQSCQDRYDGFASVFKDTKFVMGERQYSDGDNSKAQELANTLINNGVVAIYGTNDGATNGSAAAVKDAINNGMKIYCVGWDKSDSNIAHVEGGELLAFAAQNPNIMGEMAIDAVVELENGKDLAGATVDTGVSTVTKENVAQFK